MNYKKLTSTPELKNGKQGRKTEGHSLAFAITFRLFIGLFIFACALSSIISYLEHRQYSRLINQRIDYVLTTQATNASQALWNYDEPLIKNLLINTISDDSIVSAQIIDFSQKTPKVIGSSSDSLGANDSFRIIVKPLLHSQPDGSFKEIGILQVQVTYDEVERHIRHTFYFIFAFTLLTLILLTGMTYFITRRSITPVDTLTRSIISTQNGPSYIQRVKSNILEINRLFEALQTLQEHYSRYHRELIASKEESDLARDKAQKADQAKSVFLSNMSHELRTPLNSIIGMTSILMEEQYIEPEHHRMLGIVQKSSASLLEIVNDILDLSKIEDGLMTLESIPFDIYATIDNVIHALSHMASRKGLVLKASFDNSKRMNYPLGDPTRFKRILINLVSNAIKFTNDGSVTVALNYENTGPHLVRMTCTVTDTGIGIETDKLDYIFEKFTQSDETITRKFGGTGLGLAITRELVLMMGGTITVQSYPNKGSIFTISIPFETTTKLPNVIETQPHDYFVARPERVECAQCKVLAVDDHPMNQLFIKKLLEKMGFQHISLANNGAEALNMIMQNDFDLVLMDCHMPELNGFEATDAIRRLDNGKKDVPIIAMTADAMMGAREKCLDAGMDDYLTKPLEKLWVERVLRQWIIMPDEKDGEPTSDINQGDAHSVHTTPPANIEHIKEYSHNDSNAQTELIKLFYEQTSEGLLVLANNCVDGESEYWVETAHKMKGSAGFIGAQKLSSLCEQAQFMRTATAYEREQILRQIDDAFDEVCGYLKANDLL